ncbi:MAG: hypothetical protein JXA95_13385 [Spirochaetales bacterium]|nr:hypothetical protein [Spirochaetales bacterium]
MITIIKKTAIFWFLLITLPLFGDTDSVLDRLYSVKKAPLLESSWLIYVGAGILEETSSPEEALPLLQEYGWDEKSPLTKGKMALLLMDNYPIPQGLMSRLTGWERYALKDLIYLNVIGGRADVSAPVSGFDLINSLTMVLEES